MQIILVVWSTDLIAQFVDSPKWITPKMFQAIETPKGFGTILGVALVAGILTSSLEVGSLRMWSILIDMNLVKLPNSISADTHLGERTYNARLAYEYLNEHVPANAIVQNNPQVTLDRPSGLYGIHQMVISDRTSYGVPLDVYKDLVGDIGTIFEQRTISWDPINAKCRQYSIDILIIKDTDPLWDSLQDLKAIRPPIYENAYYALYSCGD
jgi:hypothetical protein